ncbi:MAG: transporter [Caulobacter sp.]|nr:transporter [Caulobacter sp.]
MAKDGSRAVSRGHAWYALGVLFFVALFNYIDRSILSILQIPLKKELHLADWQLGALTGLSFALFYTTLALPIARLADTRSRKGLMAIALTIWTGTTALTGFARNFTMLVLLRIGVGVGEAGCVPSSHSLISDYFPRHQRARAMAVWSLSLSIGSMLGFYLGGKLGAMLGWRHTFLVVGLTGLILVPILLFTVREPERGAFDGKTAAGEPGPSFAAAAGILWRLKSFRYMAMATAAHAYTQFAMTSWNAPFYDRVYHMKLATIGGFLALLVGVGGIFGTLVGGALADRLARKDPRWYMWLPAGATLLIAPFGMAQYFVNNASLSLMFAAGPAVLVAVYLGSVNSVSQSLVAANMRAFTSATLVLTVNLLGLALGPLITGAVSDLVVSRFGADSLRYAISISLVFNILASFLYLLAARALPSELKSPMHLRHPEGSADSLEATS